MKKIVRQVGYLQRLYRNARSTEHKFFQSAKKRHIGLVYKMIFLVRSM